jgi:hypothetical protein
MKKILSITLLLITCFNYSQIPQGISYQAIALNSSGNPVVSSNVGLRLSVLDNAATGTLLYTETHTKTTNPQGLFNVVIGQGAATIGTFSTINWGTNSKFLKVELDAAGGTNYVLVGTTQLLSVPYALTAGGIRTQAGQGITLTSPNGTPYQLSVNDSGQLSLPSSGTTSNYPNLLYMYGSFNSFNPATAQLISIQSANQRYAYKYLTSGTQIKFIADTNASAQQFGVDGSLGLVANGSNYNVASTGFYFISMYRFNSADPFILELNSIAPKIRINGTGELNPTYNASTETFSFIANGVINSTTITFRLLSPFSSSSGGGALITEFGDNLNDGSIEVEGTPISFPGSNSTPKNYRVDLKINFNGSGNYTITQI